MTPPDMSKEQTRELKQLVKRETALLKQCERIKATTGRQITRLENAINNGCHRIRNQHRRAANAECKALAKPLRAEQRQLRTLSARVIAGRTPEQREHAAITKRIAILEGRLGS